LLIVFFLHGNGYFINIFLIVVERLKSLRLTETLSGGIVAKNCGSRADEEPQRILDL